MASTMGLVARFAQLDLDVIALRSSGRAAQNSS